MSAGARPGFGLLLSAVLQPVKIQSGLQQSQAGFVPLLSGLVRAAVPGRAFGLWLVAVKISFEKILSRTTPVWLQLLLLLLLQLSLPASVLLSFYRCPCLLL